jgi:hypothetical protein
VKNQTAIKIAQETHEQAEEASGIQLATVDDVEVARILARITLSSQQVVSAFHVWSGVNEEVKYPRIRRKNPLTCFAETFRSQESSAFYSELFTDGSVEDLVATHETVNIVLWRELTKLFPENFVDDVKNEVWTHASSRVLPTECRVLVCDALAFCLGSEVYAALNGKDSLTRKDLSKRERRARMMEEVERLLARTLHHCVDVTQQDVSQREQWRTLQLHLLAQLRVHKRRWDRTPPEWLMRSLQEQCPALFTVGAQQNVGRYAAAYGRALAAFQKIAERRDISFAHLLREREKVKTVQ